MPAASWKKCIALSALAAIILGLLFWFIPSDFFDIPWDFRNNLWAPAYLLVHGQSPFNIKVLFTASNAIWMPVVVGLFFPIGYLPLRWAANLFLLMNLLTLLALTFLLTQHAKKSLLWSLLALGALTLFPPTMSQFFLGQVSLQICLALALLVLYFDHFQPWLIGALLAFSFTKPQLAVLFTPVLLFQYLREHGLRKCLHVFAFTVLWVIGMCLPLFFYYPNWIPDFLVNVVGNNRWFYPTLYAFLLNSSVFKGTALYLAGLWLVLGISLAEFLTFKVNRTDALFWTLALTLIFSPTIWSWDFVLLYPLLVVTAEKEQSIPSRWALMGGYAVCFLLFALLRLGAKSDHFAVWVPPFLCTVVLLNTLIKHTGLSKFPSGLHDEMNG